MDFYANRIRRQEPSIPSFFIAYGDKKRRRIHAPQSRIAIPVVRGVAEDGEACGGMSGVNTATAQTAQLARWWRVAPRRLERRGVRRMRRPHPPPMYERVILNLLRYAIE